MSKKIKCERCNGWGTLKQKEKCRICNGKGFITIHRQNRRIRETCQTCKGGGMVRPQCHMCEGAGWYKLKEDKVRIGTKRWY